MFILIVLMSFASAGFFSNLFSAKITGHDIYGYGEDTCFECMENGGNWCEEGWNDYCIEWYGTCNGNRITNEDECPCPTSCADVPDCEFYECGYCDALSDQCYYSLGACGTCGAAETCNYGTHTCEISCGYSTPYETYREVDVSEAGFADPYDVFCCDEDSDCVANADCFESDNYYPNDLDTREALSGDGSGEYCLYGIWYNEKSFIGQAACAAFSTYTYFSREVDSSLWNFADTDDKGCCSNTAECVANGYCYTKNKYHDNAPISGDSGDSGDYCLNGVWYDEESDLPSYCGDGTCDFSVGETCTTCLADCGCDSGYACTDGFCVQGVATPGCVDTDTGFDIYNAGTANSYSDSCVTTINLKEVSCNSVVITDNVIQAGSYGGIYATTISCADYGKVCNFGACADSYSCGNEICDSSIGENCDNCPEDCPIVIACSEGDGGFKPDIYSTMVRDGITYTDQCHPDSTTNILYEYICDDVSVPTPSVKGQSAQGGWVAEVTCPNGCGGAGVCLAAVAATCSDKIQNQLETDVDCGGPNCLACPDCTTNGDCGIGELCCGGSCELKCDSDLYCADINPCIINKCHHPKTCDAECFFYTTLRDGVSCGDGQVCCGGTPCASGDLCCPGGCAEPSCTANSCDDSNDCTTDTCKKSGTCDAKCDYSEYENANTVCDAFVNGRCNENGICKEPSCDKNSECVPANPESCKVYTCSNPEKWNADCGDVDIISCSMTTDGCCPIDCNSDTDVDCDDHCGDTLGVCDYSETCDTCEGDCGCGSNEYCDTAGTTATCEPGCGSDTDCDGATPKCDSSHDCVECLTDSVIDDCGVGYVCDSAGSCKIGMCEYGATNFVFPNTGDTAVVAKFMKNIKSECNAAFTIKILSVSALPTTYNLPLNQKIILILNITSDLTSTAGADLNFIINESELTLPIANLTIYVEDAAEATGWESLVPDAADIVARGNKMFGYNVKTPHFSLFLITEPELCGNGVFDTGFEVCDGSVSGVNHCTACSCDIGYHTTASGDCERDITGTDCSLIGNKSCSGFKLLECSSNLVWENEGLVIGECGVDCLAGNKSCQGEVSLLCNLNYDWTIQGVINGLCGYVVDPDAPSDRCGNGYCNYDEDEASCPEDCEADPEDIGEINWGLIALIFGIVVLILVIIIVLFKMFNKEKGRGMPPPNRRLPPEHRPGPKRAPGRPLEHNLPVGRPAAGQGPYSRRRYPPR